MKVLPISKHNSDSKAGINSDKIDFSFNIPIEAEGGST